jgi:hypothetical protein
LKRNICSACRSDSSFNSTKIFTLIRNQIPNYGEGHGSGEPHAADHRFDHSAAALDSGAPRYTTISGSFRPGLIHLGNWNYVAFAAIAFLLALLTLGPLAILVSAVLCKRIGYFVLGFTLEHWRFVLSDPFS